MFYYRWMCRVRQLSFKRLTAHLQDLPLPSIQQPKSFRDCWCATSASLRQTRTLLANIFVFLGLSAARIAQRTVTYLGDNEVLDLWIDRILIAVGSACERSRLPHTGVWGRPRHPYASTRGQGARAVFRRTGYVKCVHHVRLLIAATISSERRFDSSHFSPARSTN
jgi:hypothetical protein